MVSGSLIIVPNCPFRVGTCCGRPVVEQTQDALNEAVPLAELIESAKRLLSVDNVRTKVVRTCGVCAMVEGFLCRYTPPTPRWDNDRRELSVGQFTVLSYTHAACNQFAVLQRLELESWPLLIENPLRGKLDGEYRNRLKKVVSRLNHGQASWLVDGQELWLVQFHGRAIDGKIGWEYKIPRKGT